jgi:hypothetical protein
MFMQNFHSLASTLMDDGLRQFFENFSRKFQNFLKKISKFSNSEKNPSRKTSFTKI